MRLDQLHYFETLIHEGSFTKAAAKLHISQPSLTASIKAMEKELDKALLIRDTRSFTLTEEGKQVLAFAKETLTAYSLLLRNLNPSEYQTSGNITIVSTKFFCELILEQFLPSLRSRFPNIKVRLIENEYHTTPAHLSVAGCKFAVLTRITANDTELMGADFLIPDEVFYDKQYQYISLFTDTFGFCTAKSSLLSSIPTIYPNTIDLTQYQATTFPFGAASLSDEIFLSSNNPQLHIDAMLNDNAFCNIPYFIYQHLFSHEEALTYRAYSSNMAISYYLIYPAEHTLTAAEQIFIKELQSYLTQMEFK